MQAGGTKADAEVTEGLVPQEHPEGFLVSQRNRKLSGQALGWFKTVAGFPTRYRGVEKNPLGGPYNAQSPGSAGALGVKKLAEGEGFEPSIAA